VLKFGTESPKRITKFYVPYP